ncbi:MAG: aldehyde dehydrogenase family protein, partial [Gemmatimonadales bacterium]
MPWGPAPESASLALKWLEDHQRRLGHLIGGEWVAPGDGSWFPTIDPATGRELATVAQGSREDADRAVRAARAAQP